ncbi:MAG: hypothetical protein SF052_21695 [Bacteroidia bacterium]|nr:hypothetical protein [Bacteroidia bacterium]
MPRHSLFLFLFLLSALQPLFAVVMYDEGREMVNGIQLLRDKDDPRAFYYIPQFPRLSTKDDGSLEFLCMKYVGQGGAETNGGIFHALVEFTLPQNVIAAAEIELGKRVAGARIVGPVPMMQATEDDENGLASFKVISAILNDTEGENPFTSTVITSGYAPLLPGSKAAIAAKLNQAGATLLWESLQGPTSDISVSIHGYYEAAVKGYNAVITAEVENVYEHFSRVYSKQEGYTKRQLRNITDELRQNQVLKIEVFDRSAGLNINTKDMDNILNMVTDKLIELIFDAETGWAKQPERETAVEQGQIQGRQDRGWFARTFLGADDTPYYTDDQFVMKRREDIRVNKFYLNLSKSTTIKVPVYTSGNIGGLYDALGQNDKYFRIVNLDDAAFQKRDIHFQVDGEFTNAFEDLINFVSVSFKKDAGDGGETVTKDLVFRKEDLAGKYFQTVTYPRLGTKDDEWLNYDYKVVWSIKGIPNPINFPADETEWAHNNATSIPLAPPLTKRILEIDADRQMFKDADIRSAQIRFMTILGGKAQVHKTVILRTDDAESTNRISLYHDPNEPIAYQISWYSTKGILNQKTQVLEGEYMFVLPPDPSEFNK